MTDTNTATTVRTPWRRAAAALALAAAVVGGGATAARAAAHAEAMPPPDGWCHTTSHLLPWDEWVTTSNC